MAFIPVFEPDIGEDEIAAVVDALRKKEISGLFGTYLPAFEETFARYCGCRHGVAVTSCTAALHLAVSAIGIAPGDEILVSASTNISSALAIYHNGGIPVPVDSEPITWNLDIDLIQAVRSQYDLDAVDGKPYARLVAMCQFSEYLCALKKIRVSGNCDEPNLDPRVWTQLGLDKTALVEVLTVVNDEVDNARQFLLLAGG